MQETPKIALLCWEAGKVSDALLQMETLPGNSTNVTGNDIRPFLVFCGSLQSPRIELRQHPTWGGWLYYHPCIYELLGHEFVG